MAISRHWLSLHQPEGEGAWVGYPAVRLLLPVGTPEEEGLQVCLQPYISPLPSDNSWLWLFVFTPVEVCTWVGYPTSRLLLPVCMPVEECTQVWIQSLHETCQFLFS